MVAASELLFTGAGILLAPLAATLGLVLRPPPLALPSVNAAAIWPARLDADPGHRWFRARVVSELRAAIAERESGIAAAPEQRLT